MQPLPIDPVLPAVVDALRARRRVVLHAPTGAGKTTRVPRALHDAGFGRIVVLEPRRVAARAAAARMAHELGERVGETVGYQVRFDRKAGKGTRILVVTEGVLLQKVVADPFLEDVDVVLFDEFHERSLDADLALAMVRQAQAQLRPELAIGVMSATLDVEAVAGWLDAAIVRSEGRSFPVDVRYLPRPDDRPLPLRVAEHAAQAFAHTARDVLVFLPGVGEIHRVAGELAGRVDAEIVPLHGRLTPAEQDRALTPGDRRRIVLATNVAETSVTLPSVSAVVDAGLVRVQRHDAARGLDRLVLEPNSKASADQRAGRAGRVGPGVCWRLWTELQHRARPDHDTPEVARVDLTGPVLALLAWGEPDPRAFPWFQAPAPHALDGALDLLVRLGAVADGRLTDVGRAMAALPTHPRIGRFLLACGELGVLRDGALAAALLEDRQALTRDAPPTAPSASDLLDQLDAARGQRGHGWRPRHPGALAMIRDTAEALLARAKGVIRERAATEAPGDALRRALIAGWPDRVAVRRSEDDERVVLASGRGAKLGVETAVRADRYLVALDVADLDGADARVHLASAIEAAWLPTTDVVEATWDDATDKVVGVSERRFGALVLDRRTGVQVPAARVRAELIAAARRLPKRAMPVDDPDFARLVGRLRFVRRVRPDADLPPAEALLDGALLALAPSCRGLADLQRQDWIGAVLDQLTWPQRQQLDALAPDRQEVPSGSQIRLDYPDDGPPVLAVRIQELFGWTDTPRVAGAPVLLHLLAPNGRPQQVTSDLAGFWDRTWPEVRKDLRARYPKHSWPDDPRTAPATRGAKRRS